MKSFSSFKELKLPISLTLALKKIGFEKPTPIQASAIPPALEGRDILGTAQTGTGKTGAFAVPLLAHLISDPRKKGLILAPTRELAAQIFSVLHKMSDGTSLKGMLVIGGESFDKQVRDFRRGFNYIVATPGRLNDYLSEKTIALKQVSHLVLDEVDRMLDMGFLPQLKQILKHVPQERQTLIFSATFPEELRPLTQTLLRNPEHIAVGKVSVPTVQVKEEVIHTTDQGKYSIILREMEKRQGLVLVFARTKIRADRLARVLFQGGHNVVSLHGGKSQPQRKHALREFSSGNSRIMVATDLAARGIDVANIQHVINYDVPVSREDYIHRIGRAGRGDHFGHALNLLVTGDQDGEFIVTGQAKKPKLVFSSRNWRGR